MILSSSKLNEEDKTENEEALLEYLKKITQNDE